MARMPAELVSKLRMTTREKFVVALTGAFGLVIGLAWNDTIQALVNRLLLAAGIQNEDSLLVKVAGATVTTLIAVLAIVLISLWARKEEVK